MAKRLVFFDTETTGVKIEKDKIIEIAAFDATTKETFSSLIHPQCPIPKEATAIHNITDEMVANAPSFGEVAKDFVQFCKDDAVLVAHNNDGFDKPFLASEFLRAGVELPKWSYLDTLKWARKYRYDLPRHSLQFLRETYKITANQAHRALDDVLILAEVFGRMTQDLTSDEIVELMDSTHSMRMPFGKYQGRSLKEVPKHYVGWLEKNGVFEKAENQDLKKGFIEQGLLTC